MLLSDGAGGSALKDRNCWRSARERDRRKARHKIRARVVKAPSSGSDKQDPSHLFQGHLQLLVLSSDQNDLVVQSLKYILKGNRSKFSTSFVDRHVKVLSTPLDITRHIMENYSLREETQQMFLSWYGKERTTSLWQYIASLSTFTFLEFAAWCGKYSIMSSLLNGGVSPCVRSCHFIDSDTDTMYNSSTAVHHKLCQIGVRVLQRFFDKFPLRLSTYIVYRVIELREHAIQRYWNLANSECQHYEKNQNFFSCLCCDEEESVPLSHQLYFSACKHTVCETCFWKDLLHTIDSPNKHLAEDVVVCLVCEVSATPNDSLSSEEKKADQDSLFGNSNPNEKRKESLYKLQKLPVDRNALKSFDGRKKKVLEQEHLASSWQQAVLPSLGSTQNVRRDKFFAYVEMNAAPYVLGCLQCGVDVHWVNEYGQTALYVAVWYGYPKIVQMLLEFGSDIAIVANGDSSVLSVAKARGDVEILDLLREYFRKFPQKLPLEFPMSSCFRWKDPEATTCEPATTMLIPESLDHPGAGSFMIDNAVSYESVEALLTMFHSLPVEHNQKQKKNISLCSKRSYFCDAEGKVRQLLQHVLESCRKEAPLSTKFWVYPHMRFLNYTQPGTLLAPHIDLCRVDTFGTNRMEQSHGSFVRSTHTFILYLTDCTIGGETCLLKDVTGEGRSVTLAKVAPRRGRLFLFPHATPHEGLQVIEVPKILLRGEIQVNSQF